MGDVIRSGAAVDDIFEDVRTSFNNSVARGGTIKERAEQQLTPVITMIDAVEEELKLAKATLAPLAAALSAENAAADATLNRIYDETWNDVGRPANDRFLALIYPGGAGYYTDGDTPGQPVRMELLAKLYERKIHPKLTAAQCEAYATRVRDAATALKADVDAAAPAFANVALLERVRTALGRVAQFELSNLKRTFKIDGMSEAAIHEIIPDRPAGKKTTKKSEGKSTTTPDPTTPGDGSGKPA